MSTLTNLERHRLTNWSDFNPYMEPQNKVDFMDFVNKAYKLMSGIQPGEIFYLSRVNPENLEKFIKVGCMYILDGHSDFEFSDNYNMLKRKKIHPVLRIEEVKTILTAKRKSHELEQTPQTDRATPI